VGQGRSHRHTPIRLIAKNTPCMATRDSSPMRQPAITHDMADTAKNTEHWRQPDVRAALNGLKVPPNVNVKDGTSWPGEL
ncbi:MAG: hypothetical protein ACE1Z6_03725, partial [Candidatus Methylomirabilales bacterium]